MNEDKITYGYSVTNCIFYWIFLCWISYILISIFSDALEKHNTDGIIVSCIVTLIPIILLVRITVRYTIPAIRGKMALEINKTGIIDHVKHFVIEWHDITDL